MNNVNDDLLHAADLLRREQIVAIPTETVYGLAGNAFSEKAIQSIYQAKGRPSNNPLIVHLKDKSVLAEIATNIPEAAHKLADAFWPGPITLVLEKQAHISNTITANKNTVAVRVPNHKLTLELLAMLDFPLVAPSANRSNHISPTKAEHVVKSLGDKVPFVLDGGTCERGMESTIVGFKDNEVILYRHGAIPQEEIEAVLGQKVSYGQNHQSPESPGMFKKHYSPNTPLIISKDLSRELETNKGKRVGVICFKTFVAGYDLSVQRVLSASGDLKEASHRLYDTLHELDSMELDLILVESIPDISYGTAINDRLQRAAYR